MELLFDIDVIRTPTHLNMDKEMVVASVHAQICEDRGENLYYKHG